MVFIPKRERIGHLNSIEYISSVFWKSIIWGWNQNHFDHYWNNLGEHEKNRRHNLVLIIFRPIPYGKAALFWAL